MSFRVNVRSLVRRLLLTIEPTPFKSLEEKIRNNAPRSRLGRSAFAGILSAVVLCVSAIQATAAIDANVDFAHGTRALGEETTLTITLLNSSETATATQVAFSNTLPANLLVSPISGLTSNCGGSVSTITNGNQSTISLSGGTIPVQVNAVRGSCTVSVKVQSSIKGNYFATVPIGGLTATTGGVAESNATSATKNVLYSPYDVTLTLLTDVGTLLQGGETTVRRVRISNRNLHTLTNAGFVWNFAEARLPTTAMANNYRIRADLPMGTTCGGQVTADSVANPNGGWRPTSRLTVTGLTVPRGTAAPTAQNPFAVTNGMCEVFFTIEIAPNPVGSFNATFNTHSIRDNTFVSTEGATNIASNVVNAWSYSGAPPDMFFNNSRTALINLNDTNTATLKYTYRNWNTETISNINMTDALPSGMTAKSVVSNSCGGSIVISPNNAVRIQNGVLNGAPSGVGGVQWVDCVVEVLVEVSACQNYFNNFPATTYNGVVYMSGAQSTLGVSCELFDVTTSFNRDGLSSSANSTFYSGDLVNLKFTLKNYTASTDVTNIRIPNNLASIGTGFRVGPAGIVSNGCGGSGNVTAGATSFDMQGLTVQGGKSCDFTVQLITASDAKTQGGPFSTHAGIIQEMFNTNPANTIRFDTPVATDRLYAREVRSGTSFGIPIVLQQAFTPAVIGAHGVSRLKVSITRSSADRIGMNNIRLKNVLPTGHVIAANPDPMLGCGGSLSAVPGEGTFELTGAEMIYPVNNSENLTCTFEVNIRAPGLAVGQTSASATNTIPSDPFGSPMTTFSATDLRQPSPFNLVRNLSSASATLTRQGLLVNVSKQFGPTQIGAGGSSKVRIAILNTRTPSIPLTGVQLRDVLPAGLVPASNLEPLFGSLPTGAGNDMSLTPTPNSNGCSGGTGTASAPDPSNRVTVSLSNASIAANTTCYFQFRVTSVVGGNLTNNIPRDSSDQAVLEALTSNESAQIAAPTAATLAIDYSLNVDNNFSPAIVTAGPGQAWTSLYTIRILNFKPAGSPNLFGATTAALVNQLPAGLTIDAGTQATTCGVSGTAASVTVDTSLKTITLNGGMFPPDSICTVTVRVSGTGPGPAPYVSTIPKNALSAYANLNDVGTFQTNPDPAVATLSVIEHPTVTKAFESPIMAKNGVSFLKFTVTNPNSAVEFPAGLSGVSFSDVMTNMQVASPVQVTSTCTGATSNAAVGTTTLNVSNIVLPAGGNCEFRVAITSSLAGLHPNKVSGIASTETGSGAPDSALVNLRVVEPLTLEKSFLNVPTVNNTPQILAGLPVQMRFKISNPNPVAITLSSPGFTDQFPISPGQMYVADPVGLASTCTVGTVVQNFAGTAALVKGDTGLRVSGGAIPANGSCEITLNVAVSDGGEHINRTSDITSQGGVSPAAIASLTGIAQNPELTLTKSWSFVGNGAVGTAVKYDFKVKNTGNVAMTGVVINDPVIGAVNVATTPASLAPGAEGTLTRNFTITQANMDAGKIVNTATARGNFKNGFDVATQETDDSTTGTAPNGTALTSFGTNDPTVTNLNQSASASLAKGFTVSPTPKAGDANHGVAYSFTVKNTGNVSLSGLKIEDATLGLTGASALTVTPSPLPPGQSGTATLTATRTLTQAEIDAGKVDNQATLTGGSFVDRDGATQILGDVASVPSTKPDGTADTANTTPGLTITHLTQVAKLRLVKSAAFPYGRDVGDTITYTFKLTNTGNVTVTDLKLEDVLLGVSTPRAVNDPSWLTPAQTTSLAPGAELIVMGRYKITQADVDAGKVENRAEASGKHTTRDLPADMTTKSTTGTDENGADLTSLGESDPTIVALARTPKLTVYKDADDTALGSPPKVGDIITYWIRVQNTGTVTLTNVEVRDPLIDPNSPLDTIQSMEPGQTVEMNGQGFAYAITQADLDAGVVINTASAETTFAGNPVRDDSDEVRTLLAQEKSLRLVKSAYLDENGEVGTKVIYTFAIKNTGNVTLHDVTVEDARIGVSGLDLIQPLAPGGIEELTAEYVITQDDVDVGEIENQASVTAATSPGGSQDVTDLSTTGTEPDGTVIPEEDLGTDEETITTILTPEPAISITKVARLDGPGRVGDQVTYTITVENTGNVDLARVLVKDPMLAMEERIALTIGEVRRFERAYTLTQADVDRGKVDNVATAEFVWTDGPQPLTGGDSAEATVFMAGALQLTKSADRTIVVVGETVSYTLALQNTGLGGALSANLVDTLPTGFAYVTGSARINGLPVEPELANGQLIWRAVSVAAVSTSNVVYQVVIGGAAGPGEHVNRAQGFDPATNVAVTEEAQAIVRIEAEAVFDCATVIGRVFDDRNGDGYFKDETGLGGVRLISANGLAITTDEHGRFSVPCADLPRDLGANFQLKVDEQSLPEGFVVTTENPRVVRVTAGMVTKMNIGATEAEVMRIRLTAAAFDNEGAPIGQLEAGLRDLVAALGARPATARISYALGSEETEAEALAHMQTVEESIRALMQPTGRVLLGVERRFETTGN